MAQLWHDNLGAVEQTVGEAYKGIRNSTVSPGIWLISTSYPIAVRSKPGHDCSRHQGFQWTCYLFGKTRFRYPFTIPDWSLDGHRGMLRLHFRANASETLGVGLVLHWTSLTGDADTLEFGDHCTRLGGHLWYLKGGSESTFNAGDTPLCWEDPLEKEMATTPVFLPGESHDREAG